MKNIVLWTLDARNAEQAQGIFTGCSDKMTKPILMCLMSDSHINPAWLSDCGMGKMQWQKQEHGWLFCGGGELKWRKLSDRSVRFVYLGNVKDMPAHARDGSARLAQLEEKRGQLVAWGMFEHGSFYEQNLGQKFTYPLTGEVNPHIAGVDQRLAFGILKYIDPENGELQFWRHRAIEWAQT